jgi:branched-chain amino acid transport system permease protein
VVERADRPNTISISETIHLLIIAVIGASAFSRAHGSRPGVRRANNYLRDLPFADKIGLTPARFNTVVGLLVLAIVVVSPDGLMGLVERARMAAQKRRGDDSSVAPPDNAMQTALPNTS